MIMDEALPKSVYRQTPLKERKNNSLTLLVPVYNEEQSIKPFLSATLPVLDKLTDLSDVQIMFINDGSVDETVKEVIAAIAEDPRISLLNLARNFGKEAAMSAGLDICDSDAVIIMDVDLQDPPELIDKFYVLWREGYDVVFGERAERKTDDWLKRQTAKWFYKTFNKLSPTKIPHNAGDYRLLDRRVVTALNTIKERNRFMKGLFSWVGFSAIGVAYERAARAQGETKFRFKGLWRFALDGIFGFSTVPLRLSVYMGLLMALMALGYAIFLFVRTLVMGIDLPGYASLMVVVLTIGAVQLFSIGIMGEYISRLTSEAKQRPLYIVEGHYKHNDRT